MSSTAGRTVRRVITALGMGLAGLAAGLASALAEAPSAHAGAAPAHAEAGMPPGFVARLEQTPVVHAAFTQIKTLAALKRPLSSAGRVTYARDHGVLWQIEHPYRMGYLLTAEHVTEIAPDGDRKVRSAREVPALAQVGRVFQAIFEGDMRALGAHFEVAVSGDDAHWQVELTPGPAVARFLVRITAHGGAFLEVIEVHEVEGDYTRISFHDARFEARLSYEDAQVFMPRR